jgi:hypothetical protein
MRREGWRRIGAELGDLFPLGRLGITPAASFLLSDETVAVVIHRHAHGQWAEPDHLLSLDDQEVNERILADRRNGGIHGEILSKYQVRSRINTSVEIYVITTISGKDATTTVCLPHER